MSQHVMSEDKGLVINYEEGGYKTGGGATKWEGGICEVLPLRKGGLKKF